VTGPVIDDVMTIRPAELFQTSGGMAASEMGMQAAQGIPLRFESFDGLPRTTGAAKTLQAGAKTCTADSSTGGQPRKMRR